jgi:iron complex transport system ATP-binding protein
MIITDGFSGKTTPGMKREHGEAYPKGTETVAAPATVSGERRLTMPLAPRPGRQGEAETREPGDLPSILKFEPDGVCRERCDVTRLK